MKSQVIISECDYLTVIECPQCGDVFGFPDPTIRQALHTAALLEKTPVCPDCLDDYNGICDRYDRR